MESKTGIADNLKKTSFEYLYNQLFLPRKLSREHEASGKNEGLLLNFVLHSLQRFLPDRHDATAISVSISMLKSLRQCRNEKGHLKDAGVRKALQGLTTEGIVSHIPLKCTPSLTIIL